MTYLSVCAIFRDEADYLEEWIEFHRLVGVERFFLYDNGSVDDSRKVLARYAGGDTVQVHDWSEPQYAAYDDCLARHGGDSRWIAFIDLDEFLSPPARPFPRCSRASSPGRPSGRTGACSAGRATSSALKAS